MHKIFVDGSYCEDKSTGGVGGYILNENHEYVAHFAHSLQSKPVHHYYEMIAIIAGLNCAIEHNISDIIIYNDDVTLINRLNKIQDIKAKEFYDMLLHRIYALGEQFASIKFEIFKCSHAHDLSRVYLKEKNEHDIEKQLRLLNINKRRVDGAPNINKCINITNIKKRKHNKKKKKVVMGPAKEKGIYFLDLPGAKNVYVYPARVAQSDTILISLHYDNKNDMFYCSHNNNLILGRKTYRNVITMSNYCLALISNRYKNQHITIKLNDELTKYWKYLWSENVIPEDNISSFKNLVRFLNQNNCTQIAFIK